MLDLRYSHLVVVTEISNERSAFFLKVQPDRLIQNMKALRCFETSVTTRQRDIPED
jgi:hypothetical protein